MNRFRRLSVNSLYQWLVRKTRRPAVGKVDFGDLCRLTPISKAYGFDRGLPIDRHYVEHFLATHAASITGKVLEIGDDSYSKRFGGDRIAQMDVLNWTEGNPAATIVADLTAAPQIASNSFDCVVFTQTLHFVTDIYACVETLHRILKPGGVVLATLPTISKIEDPDEFPWNDNWRFTSFGARWLFEKYFEPGQVQVKAYGNVFAATAFLHGIAAEEIDGESLACVDPLYEMVVSVKAEKKGKSDAVS